MVLNKVSLAAISLYFLIEIIYAFPPTVPVPFLFSIV